MGRNPQRNEIKLFEIFDGKSVWLEIGFGGGEHLIHQAGLNPDIGFIGCEPYQNGVAKLMGKLSANPCQNIKVYDGDVRNIFDVLANNSISKVFLLYPDPWPKKRHHRRRFVTQEFLVPLYEAMKPGSILRIATDIEDYVRQALQEVPKAGFEWLANDASDWRTPWQDWASTRYEIKALNEEFNANLHQAMFEKETNEFEDGKVCEIVQEGYTFHDRLLRPVLVGVAKKSNENNDDKKIEDDEITKSEEKN